MKAFSLLELILTLVIVGVVIAIGVPAINNSRNDAELETMRARALLLQNAKLSLIDAVGTVGASGVWQGKSDQQRYSELLTSYLPTPQPTNLTALIPSPFGVNLGSNLGTPVAFTAPDKAQGGRAVKMSLQKY